MKRGTIGISSFHGAFRVGIAAVCVLLFVISGFVHAALHASQPIPSGIVQFVAPPSETTSDNQPPVEIEVSHCLACAAASIPVIALTSWPSTAFATIVAKAASLAVQQRRHADPPPPKV